MKAPVKRRAGGGGGGGGILKPTPRYYNANNYYHQELADNFTNHTISSAIKADYAQPDVKFKLDELNESVKKTRIIKRKPSRRRVDSRPKSPHTKPFVIRKVIG